MSRKKAKKKQEERERKALHYAKASVGAVLEMCSGPELAVIIRFLERKDYDAVNKVLIFSSAAYDIRAARRAEDAATKRAARKLNRPEKFDKDAVVETEAVPGGMPPENKHFAP